MSHEPRWNAVDRRVALAAVVMAALASVLAPMAFGSDAVFAADLRFAWWAMVVPFALADGIELRFRVGQSMVFATLVEVPYVVGLLTMTGRDLMVAHLVGGAVALVVLRFRPTILIYNLAGFAADCCAALLVFHALADPTTATRVQGWLAVTAAMVTSALACSARVVLLAWFRGRRPDRGALASTAVTLAAAVVNATLAFLALRVVLADPPLVWLVGGLALVLLAVYRNYVSLLNHHEGLNRLYEATQTLDLLRAHDGSVATMLDQAVELLGAEYAELVVVAADGTPRRCYRAAHGEPVTEVGDGEVDAVDVTTAGVVSPDARTLVGRLHGADGPLAVLRVVMFSGTEFSEGDRRLFEMFVNHAGVALQNSQLVDQLRSEAAQRRHESLHDSLTALPNRVMFDLRTRRALGSRPAGAAVAVALVDLDRFKEVNDTLGHERGDELLAALARRLDVLADDRGLVVSRLGGDEFAVLVTGARTVEEVAAIAGRVKSTIEEAIEIAGVRIDVTASVGVSLVDDASPDVDGSTLLRRADVAMYIAKRQHLGLVFYDRAVDPYSPARLSLAADLRHAVERGEIEAYFQPEIDLRTGEVISVEALARWTHPVYGAIVPDQFIPIAEQSGLIRDLTYLMLEQSLERIREWRRHGFDLSVAVNLSVRCLSDDGLVDNVVAALDRMGLGPEVLTLEVTEGTIMADPEHALEVLSRLAARGIRLSIDDFGMGYSSLAQLKRMPVGQLKVDRSFVTFVSEDPADAAIVKSVTELGHNLGLEVIAEGVEDQATLDTLTRLGCDSVQGFFLSRPMSGDQALRWLRQRRDELSAVEPAR